MHSPDEIPPPTDPILVVDDEKIFLSALQLTLQRAGYPAVALDSPLEALKELERRKFSVIISDQLMPELSGLELLARARQIQPYATRILATAVLNLAKADDEYRVAVYRWQPIVDGAPAPTLDWLRQQVQFIGNG